MSIINNTTKLQNILDTVNNLPEGSGGEQVDWSANEDARIAGTLSSYFNDRVKNIDNNAFYKCTNLTSVNFPACTNIGSEAFYSCSRLISVNFPMCANIGSNAFRHCSSLTSVSFPVCTDIGSNAFYQCTSLTSVSFPVCTDIGKTAFYQCIKLISVNFPMCANIGSSAFYNCTKLTTADFPLATTIDSKAFYCCYNLKSLYLTNSVVCTLSNSNAFTSTPIGGYSTSAGTYGSIYVPASLVVAYKSATNWVTYSNRITAIPE